MNTVSISPENLKQNGKYAMFHEIDENTFFIDSVCIFTENQIITRNQMYDLIDLTKTGGMFETRIKFLNAILRGFDFYIVGIDIKTGNIIKRHHRLDFGECTCDWVLIGLDYLNNNKTILEFDF